MLRRLEENSSLDRPAIEHLAVDVLQLGDGLHALAVLVRLSGRLTDSA